MSERLRIAPDPQLAPVQIPGRTLNEICAHARESQPEECCGLVTGLAAEPFRTVYRCRNEMTALHRSDPEVHPRDGTAAFYMSEVDYLAAQEEAEARGESVVAIYHSHVGVGAYFSELDQEFASHALFPFPDAAHIVVGVFDGKISEAGIFEPAEAGFVGRYLEARAE